MASTDPVPIDEGIAWRDLQGREWVPREVFERVRAERDHLRDPHAACGERARSILEAKDHWLKRAVAAEAALAQIHETVRQAEVARRESLDAS